MNVKTTRMTDWGFTKKQIDTITLRYGSKSMTRIDEILHKNFYPLPHFEPQDLVVDVGAGIGAFSLACFANNARRFFALEPSPTNVSIYKFNMKELNVVSTNYFCVRGIVHHDDMPVAEFVGDGERLIVDVYSLKKLVDRVSDSVLSRQLFVPGSKRMIRVLRLNCHGGEWPALYYADPVSFDHIQTLCVHAFTDKPFRSLSASPEALRQYLDSVGFKQSSMRRTAEHEFVIWAER